MWRWPHAQEYRHLLMASVESGAEALEASSAGWGVFRVLGLHESFPSGYQPCRKRCIDCMRCDGKPNRKIAIYAHGKAKRRFGQLRQERLL
jgi:hypothetical protein